MFYCSTTVGVCASAVGAGRTRAREGGRIYSFEVFCPTCVSYSSVGGLLSPSNNVRHLRISPAGRPRPRWRSSSLLTKDVDNVCECEPSRSIWKQSTVYIVFLQARHLQLKRRMLEASEPARTERVRN